MDQAQKEGLVAESIPVAFLEPVLVVNAATQERLRRQGRPVTGLKDLLRDDLQVILGNIEGTSIGKLSRDVLSRPGIELWPKLESLLRQQGARVSTVGTVNEVVQKVYLLDRAVGIAWKSVAEQYRDQDKLIAIVTVPELSAARKQMFLGVLAHLQGAEATAALHFGRFLTARDRGLKTFEQMHYETMPDADEWADQPEVYLSAGAMLQASIEDVVATFSRREGVRMHTDYAGCGLLVAKMKAARKGATGGRFPDAYFACDLEFLDMVRSWFDAAELVSRNELVLIVPKGNPKKIKGLDDLARRDLRKIGLGDAEFSALGKITDDLLRKNSLYHQVYSPGWQDRIHLRPAGHLLVADLRLGKVEVAVVYRSNVLANPLNEKAIDIVALDLDEAQASQPFAIARDTRHKYLMQRLLRAIVAQRSADRFKALGFRWVYHQ
jgi:ABC-type molybdate transport system substrate-binding protein